MQQMHPVYGCTYCSTTGGLMACPIHGRNVLANQTVDTTGTTRVMTLRPAVTHYVDEDWGPFCRCGNEGDSMWAFIDDKITCPDCRRLIEAHRGDTTLTETDVKAVAEALEAHARSFPKGFAYGAVEWGHECAWEMGEIDWEDFARAAINAMETRP